MTRTVTAPAALAVPAALAAALLTGCAQDPGPGQDPTATPGRSPRPTATDPSAGDPLAADLTASLRDVVLARLPAVAESEPLAVTAPGYEVSGGLDGDAGTAALAGRVTRFPAGTPAACPMLTEPAGCTPALVGDGWTSAASAAGTAGAQVVVVRPDGVAALVGETGTALLGPAGVQDVALGLLATASLEADAVPEVAPPG